MNLISKPGRFLFRHGVVSLLLLAAMVPLFGQAQSPTQKAWAILNAAVVDANIEKRTSSVSALGLITKDPEAEELAEHALVDAKPEVRVSAAAALGDMQASGAIPALKRALKDTDPSVVLGAAHSLLTLKDKTGYEVYYAILTGKLKGGGGLLAEQRKMLDDPRKMARFGFETGVGFIPFGGLGLTAIRILTKDDASQVRAAAAKILVADPDPQSGQALAAAAADKSWVVRAAVCDAIARRGQRSLAARIEPQLDDEKPVVQYLAAAAILRLNEPPTARRRK